MQLMSNSSYLLTDTCYPLQLKSGQLIFVLTKSNSYETLIYHFSHLFFKLDF